MATQTLLPTLGVNLDHIATIRQLRGTPYPSLLEAAKCVEAAGAHQITVHLREDRRHIQDADVVILKNKSALPLNLEMALTPAMIKFAKKIEPEWVCLVPEKRSEVTTEGGLKLSAGAGLKKIAGGISQLRMAGIQVSCFIEPDEKAVRFAAQAGADAIEIHTGKYCLATQAKKPNKGAIEKEIKRIRKAAEAARAMGLVVHAGHGFDFENVRAIAALDNGRRGPLIQEYNIGHSIVARAALVGLERAVREMLAAIQAP